MEATTNGRHGLCRSYRVACLGGHDVDSVDRAADLDGPPLNRVDLGGSHADLAPVLSDQIRTVCRVVVLADLHAGPGGLLACLAGLA